MNKNAHEPRWLFAVHAHDKPGALTAVASVFSNRGVSLRMILGTGGHAEPEAGEIFLVFDASESGMTALRRVVERLAKVVDLRVFEWASPQLRMLALVRTDPLDAAGAPEGVQAIPTGPRQVMVMGPPPAVEQWLETHGLETPSTWIILPVEPGEENVE